MLGEGPQYSMYPKREQKIEFTPGPGDYEQLSKSGQGVSIGKRYEDKIAEEIPGPGNYQTKSQFSEGPKYSIYQKRQGKIEQTPGPGDYEQPKKKGKGVTIGKKMKSKKPEDLPGPGNYKEISHIQEGPKYSIYTKRTTKIDLTPGPGDYYMPKKKGKGVTIGKKFKQGEIDDLPGPGRYRTRSRISEGPKYSIFTKRQEKTIEDTPGPGSYNSTFR